MEVTSRSQGERHVVGCVVVVLQAVSPQGRDGTVAEGEHVVGCVVVVLRAGSPQGSDVTVAERWARHVACQSSRLMNRAKSLRNSHCALVMRRLSSWWGQGAMMSRRP